MTEEATQNETGDSREDHQDENSPVIRDLRRMLKNEKQARKDLESRLETAEADVRVEIQRESTVKSHLSALSMPEKLYEKLDLNDVDLSREGIANALQDQLGFEVDPDAPTSTQEPEPSQPAPSSEQEQGLQRVASLSSQVRAISSGNDPRDITAKIQGAQSQEELNQLMIDQGLSADYGA